MNDFTASNGVEVQERPASVGGGYRFGPGPDMGVFSGITSDQGKALREFFQAQEDARLGRWRVPERPHWVCYPTPHAYEVVVFNEDEPQYGSQLLTRGGDTWPYYRPAADAYFEAHPEPKPWHDAKPGEVWRFETPDDRRHALGWVARDGSWDLMTPRGENVREVADPMVWLVEAWGDEFEGAKATRFVPEVQS